GTGGELAVPDPWLWRLGWIELERDGVGGRLPVDPAGEYGLGEHADPDNDDAYRIEFDTASRVITGEPAPPFGRADAVDQAAAIEAVRTAAATGTTVTLAAPPSRPLPLPTRRPP